MGAKVPHSLAISITLDDRSRECATLKDLTAFLQELAGEAGRCIEERKARAIREREARLRLGRALLQAKAQVPHGQWLHVYEQLGISRKTAQACMRLAEVFADDRGRLDAAKVEAAKRNDRDFSGRDPATLSTHQLEQLAGMRPAAVKTVIDWDSEEPVIPGVPLEEGEDEGDGLDEFVDEEDEGVQDEDEGEAAPQKQTWHQWAQSVHGVLSRRGLYIDGPDFARRAGEWHELWTRGLSAAEAVDRVTGGGSGEGGELESRGPVGPGGREASRESLGQDQPSQAAGLQKGAASGGAAPSADRTRTRGGAAPGDAHQLTFSDLRRQTEQIRGQLDSLLSARRVVDLSDVVSLLEAKLAGRAA